MTRAGCGLAGTLLTAMPPAQSIAATMSESLPPHLPSTRTGSSITSRPTEAMPMPLPVWAASRPAVWVPCQLLFSAAWPLPHSPAVVQSPGSLASGSRPLPSPEVAVSLMKS